MSDQKINSPLPITYYKKNGSVQVPLDQAIQNPSSVMNTTEKTYLPTPTRVPGDVPKR